MEEIDQPANLECNISTPDPHASKKRKMGERVVVSVKIEESDKKQKKSEGPPEDCWSWRKYGQKPIKGSPYPRGYYRCSSSKGCSAKKQVEICKTDSSRLIITYTSTHNHPGPADSDSSPTREKLAEENVIRPGSVSSLDENLDRDKKLENSLLTNSQPTTPEQEAEPDQPQDQIPVTEGTDKEQFHYSQSPFNSSQDHIMVNQEGNPFAENLDQTPVVLYKENFLHWPFSDESVSFSSILKSEENDFYDELEELPTSSFFTSLMRGSLCEERVLVNPS